MNKINTQPVVTTDCNQLPFPYAAEADISTIDEQRHLPAQVSKLSKHGCYVHIPDFLDEGTRIRIRVKRSGRNIELPGTIIYMHRGRGMGIRFGEVDATQGAILDEWATLHQWAMMHQWFVELCQKSEAVRQGHCFDRAADDTTRFVWLVSTRLT